MAPFSTQLAPQPILLAVLAPMPMHRPHPTQLGTNNGSETLRKRRCLALNRDGVGSTGRGRRRLRLSGVIKMVLLLVFCRRRLGTGRSSVVVFLIMLVWGCRRIISSLHVLECVTYVAIEMYSDFAEQGHPQRLVSLVALFGLLYYLQTAVHCDDFIAVCVCCEGSCLTQRIPSFARS